MTNEFSFSLTIQTSFVIVFEGIAEDNWRNIHPKTAMNVSVPEKSSVFQMEAK